MRLIRKTGTLTTLVLGVWVAVLVGLTSCDTKNIGGPVHRGGPIPILTAPIANLAGGQTAIWTVHWIGGKAPYTVAWDFGGGAENIGAAAASSPATAESTWRDATEENHYMVTVTVTDALGMSGTSAVTVTIAPTPNNPPVIESMVAHGSTLSVTVSDADGDPIAVTVSEFMGMEVDQATKYADESGIVVFQFHVSFSDDGIDGMLHGINSSVTVTADDGRGGITVEVFEFITIAPFVPEDDTLYALPQARLAAVGDLVTILIYTGETAHSFQFMLGVGVVLDDDASYESGTFNVGSPGGSRDDADGVWEDITVDGGFALGPDALVIPGNNPEDSLGASNRYDFNISPLIIGTDPAEMDMPSVTGALFNFQVSYSSAGEKTISFQEFNGVNRTYYSDFASGESRFWSAYVGATITVN